MNEPILLNKDNLQEWKAEACRLFREQTGWDDFPIEESRSDEDWLKEFEGEEPQALADCEIDAMASDCCYDDEE